MTFRLNVDFHGLCAIVPMKRCVSILMVSTAGEMAPDMHFARLYAQVVCLDRNSVKKFEGLSPSADGRLIASMDIDGTTTTLARPKSSVGRCERRISGQNYPDARDCDDWFWLPNLEMLTKTPQVKPAAMKPAPNPYVRARVEVQAGTFVALRHLTRSGRYSRFVFEDGLGNPRERAFADSVRLTLDVDSDPFPVVLVRDRKRTRLLVSPDSEGTAWMAFANLPRNPSASTNPMHHMPMFGKVQASPLPANRYPAIDSNNPTFGKTGTTSLNVHTSTCPPLVHKA